MKKRFLPINKDELHGSKEVDVVLITGDAYVDHPSFGAAVIGRVLENAGFSVGVIAMPDWRNPESITVFGRPRLFFAVTSGNVDSMVARYTAFKKVRSDDPYAPGGRAGHRPERAVIVYSNLIRKVYKDTPIVIGGIEASMRRAAHYDFWSNKVRRSIIEDSRAAVLIYGMGEFQVQEIARRIASGEPPSGIPGTVIMNKEAPADAELLPPEEEVIASKETFAEFYRRFYRGQQRVLAQPAGKRLLVHYPYYEEISAADLDRIYELPYMREPHPVYKEKIPAFEMICNSVTAHRGCTAGCSFCSLTLHQGKRIISRSPASVLREVEIISGKKYFKGQITDIGGPSANMYGFRCKKEWRCNRESCLFPSLCPRLEMDSGPWLALLKEAAALKNIKKVTVGSGIRYDLLMQAAGSGQPMGGVSKGKKAYRSTKVLGVRNPFSKGFWPPEARNSINPQQKRVLKTLLVSHISGQLKIAPEHTDPVVLRAMRKVPLFDLSEFVKLFFQLQGRGEKKQYLLPYLMSCFPGSSPARVRKMKKEIQRLFGFVPQQVQAFLPLPMTLAAAIYYTGVDPLTGEKFPVERSMEKRRKEHNVLVGAER
ncbi:MAG: YgiQ family radical SAM protein [Candidatus Aminicenantes bacterium]|nr:YgiQ family radical SAM protein [Candidatus Aminicenantes bacterium]